MTLRKSLILRGSPTGPASDRPEDRLLGRLEGRTALVQPDCDIAARTGLSVRLEIRQPAV